MKNIKKLMCILLSVVCALLMCSCRSADKLAFGTGGIGGNYYAYGSAYAQLIGAENEKLSVEVKATAGSAANLRLIQQGFLDIAVVQSDMLTEAYNGENSFAEMPCRSIRALAALYTEECQLIVRADSDIYTVSDLYGKTVSVGEEESGTLKDAELIMQLGGLVNGSVKKENLSFSDSAAALENGTIDAFFVTAGLPTTAVTELAKETAIRIVSLDEKIIDRMTDGDSDYTVCTIPANTYAGQTEEVRTVGVKAVLVASGRISDDTAEQLVRILFDHSSELYYATSASEFDVDFAVSGISIPFHSGAAGFYEEQGVTVNTNADKAEIDRPSAAQD